MRININRLSKLAGLNPVDKKSLNEGTYHEGSHEEAHNEEKHAHHGMEALEEEELGGGKTLADLDEGEYAHEAKDEDKEEAESADEMVYEIDEADLVMELRRMKSLMEAKKRAKLIKESKEQQLQEAELKRIIDQEVRNVMQELNLTGGWMYGDNKPTRSKRGYTHQGSFLKGLGFK